MFRLVYKQAERSTSKSQVKRWAVREKNGQFIWKLQWKGEMKKMVGNTQAHESRLKCPRFAVKGSKS